VSESDVEAVRSIKVGKAPGLDGRAAECVKWRAQLWLSGL
jgi:hypothetical protein